MSSRAHAPHRICTVFIFDFILWLKSIFIYFGTREHGNNTPDAIDFQIENTVYLIGEHWTNIELENLEASRLTQQDYLFIDDQSVQ